MLMPIVPVKKFLKREIGVFRHVIFEFEVECDEVVEEEANAQPDDAGEFRTFEPSVLRFVADGTTCSTCRSHHDGTETGVDVEVVVQNPREQVELTRQRCVVQADVEVHRRARNRQRFADTLIVFVFLYGFDFIGIDEDRVIEERNPQTQVVRKVIREVNTKSDRLIKRFIDAELRHRLNLKSPRSQEHQVSNGVAFFEARHALFFVPCK